MSDDRILVVDEGTTGTRALVFDGHGTRLSASYSEFTQHHPAPDRVEHDAEEIWRLTLDRIHDALRAADITAADLVAVGITNQRGTSLLWDRATGEAVTRAIVWQDLRTAPIAAALAPEWGAKVRQRTGWTLAPVYSSMSLHWLLEDDADLRRRAEAGELAFGTIDSWLVYKLSGGAAHVISASNAVVTGCYDIHTGEWYGEWLDALNIPRAVLPQVVDDSGVIANTSADVLGAEVPIAAAVADQSAALFGQGCLRPGEAKTTHGTGTFLDLNTGSTPVISDHGLSTIIAWRLDGVVTYGLEGYAPVTGAAVQWLRDGAGLLGSAAETETLARSVPDTQGVYFVPALTGLAAPSWDSTARGLLIGLSPGTIRPHIVRAALEGIVYSIKDFIDLMAEESGRPITVLR
ncbi:MAG TPA: FGGY family carbohydrate kinase, partial [Pseudonocardia sp.]|nr:FGGY family carbohydrate kinase [Pseudonocardia sp.]